MNIDKTLEAMKRETAKRMKALQQMLGRPDAELKAYGEYKELPTCKHGIMLYGAKCIRCERGE